MTRAMRWNYRGVVPVRKEKGGYNVYVTLKSEEAAQSADLKANVKKLQ